jgi:hypothetical protein
MEQVPRECQVVSTWPGRRVSGWRDGGQRSGEGIGGSGGRQTLGPVHNSLNIIVGVLEVFQHVLRVGVEEAGFRGFALFDWHAPAAVLDAGSDIAWEGILYDISPSHTL